MPILNPPPVVAIAPATTAEEITANMQVLASSQYVKYAEDGTTAAALNLLAGFLICLSRMANAITKAATD